MNAPTDLCSETTEQKSPPAETGPGAEPKKRLPEGPQHSARELTWRVFPGAAILFNVQHARTMSTDYTTTGLWAYSPVVSLSSSFRHPLSTPFRA